MTGTQNDDLVAGTGVEPAETMEGAPGEVSNRSWQEVGESDAYQQGLEAPSRSWGLPEEADEQSVAASSEAPSDLVGRGEASRGRKRGEALPYACNTRPTTTIYEVPTVGAGATWGMQRARVLGSRGGGIAGHGGRV